MRSNPAAAAAGLALCLIASLAPPSLCCLQAPAAAETARAASLPAPRLPLPDTLLTRAEALYYSMPKDLASFDCAVHPEWRDVFAIANPSVYIRDNDPRLRLLDSVKITMHAAMRQGSTIHWEAPATHRPVLNREQADLLESMHKATEQTLLGFLQFWKLFVDGSTIPTPRQTIEIVASEEGGRRIRSELGSASVMERFDQQMLLKELDIETASSTLEFAPTYVSTSKGMLAVGIGARIRQKPAGAEKPQTMRVALDYAEVDGVWLPSRLDMTVAGTGTFNFRLDGCRLTRSEKALSSTE